MFHRIQAAALAKIDEDNGAESAIEEINKGLDQLKIIFEEYASDEESFDDFVGDSDSDDSNNVIPPPPRNNGRSRRGAASKTNYAAMLDSDDESDEDFE